MYYNFKIKLAEHVKRIDEHELNTRIMECILEGVRRRGRPNFRGMDGMGEDLSRLKLNFDGWSLQIWNQDMEEAKASIKLYC